ncbi:MAG: hypothetical protein ACREQL_03835 [Candidatus Binatia bacterium]
MLSQNVETVLQKLAAESEMKPLLAFSIATPFLSTRNTLPLESAASVNCLTLPGQRGEELASGRKTPM